MGIKSYFCSLTLIYNEVLDFYHHGKWHAWSPLANGGMFPKSIYEIIIALHDIYLTVSSNIYKIHVLPLYVLISTSLILCCSKYYSPHSVKQKGTVYPKKYAHGFVVLCFVVVMQSFIMNSHEVFIHIHQGCFAGTGAIVRLPQCQWSKPDGYGKISQCITTTKHKLCAYFLGYTVCAIFKIWDKESWTLSLSICSLWQSSCTKI